MTAEVAIMNKLAIALAADSAVTFGDLKQQKIYNAANKLFALSKHEPVGVMIYGSAEIMGIPWETLLKTYREELGSTAFAELPQYFEHFVSFLGSSDRFFPAVSQELFLKRKFGSYLTNPIRQTILERVAKAIKAKKKITEADAAAIADAVIAEQKHSLDSRPFAKDLDANHLEYLITRYDAAFRDAIKQVLQQMPLSEEQIVRLIYLGASLFTRDVLPGSRSGIVVAGFGRDDVFPRLIAIELDARMGDKLHCVVMDTSEVTTEVGAIIVPFAQSDVVNLFIEGIDSNYEQMVLGFLEEMFRDYPKELLKTLPEQNEDDSKALVTSWQNIGDQLLTSFRQKTQEYVQEKYVQPMMNVVAALPKSELAALAEAFVNLTSLKRRVSMDLETVGGPVDVAVISERRRPSLDSAETLLPARTQPSVLY